MTIPCAFGLDSAATIAEQQVAAHHGAGWIEPGVLRLALTTPTLPPATTTNHVFIGRDAAVIVDPSAPSIADHDVITALKDALVADAGWTFSALLLSHHHRDHIGAAAALRERLHLPVVAHVATVDLVADAVIVDATLAEGDRVGDSGDNGFTVVHLPGHAPGLIALHRDRGRWRGGAIVTDMVAGEGTILVDPSDGDMGHYLSSLERLRSLQLRWMLPAHGDVMDVPDAVLHRYLQHRRRREARILSALNAQPICEDDLLPAAYGDVDPAIWPLAVRALRSHLMHLERQGLVDSIAGGGGAIGWRVRTLSV
jgi:endoribonuclease LACTB2